MAGSIETRTAQKRTRERGTVSMGLTKRVMVLCSVLVTLFFSGTIVMAEDFTQIPVKGRVTMVDLGAKKCVPCKMMAPILVKLEAAYEGRAAIVFIDVWENREQAPRFKIRAIPTQIFFDEQGQEVFRHVGFFDERSIVEQLSQMGVEKPGSLGQSVNQGS